MIKITPTISINEKEIKQEFVRASGPGGQNVNKVASAVKLRFDVLNTQSLPDDVRNRLIKISETRINSKGILIIDARRFRTQEKNRKDAVDRLIKLIKKASEKPRLRKKTKISQSSHQKRLENKKRQSMVKRMRKPVSRFDE